MSEPYIGEIRMWSIGYAPKYWANCDGQQMEINQNQTLYAIIGTYFGGDGVTKYNLPDLRGRTPVGTGLGVFQGMSAGYEKIALTTNEMPSHDHTLQASSSDADTPTPVNGLLAKNPDNFYGAVPSTPSYIHPNTITATGNGNGHENRQPFLAVRFCIALEGIFPSRN